MKGGLVHAGPGRKEINLPWPDLETRVANNHSGCTAQESALGGLGRRGSRSAWGLDCSETKQGADCQAGGRPGVWPNRQESFSARSLGQRVQEGCPRELQQVAPQPLAGVPVELKHAAVVHVCTAAP